MLSTSWSPISAPAGWPAWPASPMSARSCGPASRERLARLVRVLRCELDRRQAATGASEAEPCLVVLVDGFSALRAALEDPRQELLDDLDRVLTEGPRHGIVMAATADRAGSVPLALATVTSQKWVFQPADRGELASFGLRPADVPAWCPGAS